MHKKYQIGGVIGSSSSPLTSLMPLTSPFQKPNYGNAFLFNPLALLLGISLMSDYALEFKNKMLPSMDLMKLLIGLATQDSSDPLTALKGKEMVSDVTNETNYSLIIPSKKGKTKFSDKFSNSTFGKNFGAWSTGLDIANTAFTGLFGEKGEYSGEKGDVTRTIDSAYDSMQNLAGNFGPIGQVVSLGMGANKLLGNVANKLGAGTSGMTTTDAILGSSFLLLTPIGLINGFGGKKADTITKDQLAFEVVGSSYTGSNLKVNDALLKSGKKYGLLSSGSRRKANREIAEAKRLQAIISDIAEDSTSRFNIRNSIAAINGNNYALLLQGGYDLRAVRVGRKGLKVESITKAREILSKYKLLQTNLLLLGGTLDPFESYLNSLPENQRDSTNFRVKDYWVFNGKPKDFKEARRRGMFTLEKNGWHASTIAWNPETGEGEFMKSPDHPSILLEIDWYNSDNGSEFRSEYELVKSSPYWKYVKRLQKEIPSHKDGGTFIEISVETSIELVDPMTIPEFQNGGSINVIPDGALHARKHNMDVDGITKKGIPVVSEKDGEIELLAEIERNEVILRLEVTLKLEELEKKFYSEESTQEEKDECALEAGKLLVYELLENTIDNTGLLNET